LLLQKFLLYVVLLFLLLILIDLLAQSGHLKLLGLNFVLEHIVLVLNGLFFLSEIVFILTNLKLVFIFLLVQLLFVSLF